MTSSETTAAGGRIYVGVLIGLLLLVNILNFIDRQIPFILAESIKRDLRLSDTQVGILGGVAFSVVYSILGLPLAALADRIGRKWVLAGSLLCWSALTALGGFAQSFVQLVATRLGVAAGEAGSTPTSHALIADHFPPARRGVPLAIFSLGVPLGSMLGLFLGGWINDVAGWRQALFLAGAPGIVLSLAVVLIVREPRRSRAEIADRPPPLHKTLGLLLAKRTFRHLAAGIALYSMGANATIVFTAPFLMRSHEMSAASVGLWLGLLYGVAGVAGTLVGGVVGDVLGKRDARWRLWAPALGLAIAAPFTLAAWFVPSAGLSILLLAAPKFANLLYIAPMFVAVHSLAPAKARATSSALLLFFNGLLGVSLGPLITGLLSDGLEPAFGDQSLRYALVFVVVTQLWAALHFALAARTLRADQDPRTETG
jgi:predicted MFS family arabinose efflux permease